MKVFVKIFDPDRERIERFGFPKLLEEALNTHKNFEEDDYIVEFYSIVDEKRLEKLYSSKKKPIYNPEKDELFVICGLFWDERYSYMLEEMKLEVAPIFREIRKERVQLYSSQGGPGLQNAAREKFKGIFGSCIRSRVDCLMDDCDVIMNEYAHKIAKWITEEVEK